MKISKLESFIVHMPVTRGGIADSTHSLTHWGAPGVIIETDSGLRGYGYTGTHAHLASDRLIASCIDDVYAPLLIGQDPSGIQSLWERLVHYPPVQWVGRAGITQLALSAIDVALWDIQAKAAGVPLWRLLGGQKKKLRAYNTDGGWLNWTQDQLVSDARKLIDTGYTGVKIKVGHERVREDLVRTEAVRAAIGDDIDLMVDANGRWNLAQALDFSRAARGLQIRWLEEPLWYDDVIGHATLARSSEISIALGEQLYTFDHFREFIAAGAVTYVQPDAVRLAGITEFLQVANLAMAYRLPVAPHVGDMAQVHLQLAIAHPSCNLLEYIPWMRDCFEEPAAIENGYYAVPEAPGAGTTFRQDAMERFRVA